MISTVWIEVVATVVLSVSTVFSFVNQQYATAVVVGVCAGVVGGLTFAKAFYGRRP